jgi:hypothetical protein
MPNPEMVNIIYLLADQWVRRHSSFAAESALRQTLPKFSRLVAIFGQ